MIEGQAMRVVHAIGHPSAPIPPAMRAYDAGR